LLVPLPLPNLALGGLGGQGGGCAAPASRPAGGASGAVLGRATRQWGTIGRTSRWLGGAGNFLRNEIGQLTPVNKSSKRFIGFDDGYEIAAEVKGLSPHLHVCRVGSDSETFMAYNRLAEKFVKVYAIHDPLAMLGIQVSFIRSQEHPSAFDLVLCSP
jgi:hypothetical protein